MFFIRRLLISIIVSVAIALGLIYAKGNTLNLAVASTDTQVLQAQSQSSNKTEQPSAIEQLLAPSQNNYWFEPMVGDWQVQQTTRPSADAQPTIFNDIIARNRWIGDHRFLEEEMQHTPDTIEQEPFTRMAYYGYNNANQRFEHFNLDTRFPRMMYFDTFDGSVDSNSITLYLPAFILPGWGTQVTGQSIKERRVITIEGTDRYKVQQYWTPPAGEEYLFNEYIYTRIQGNR